jgi:hypothetical protein
MFHMVMYMARGSNVLHQVNPISGSHYLPP